MPTRRASRDVHEEREVVALLPAARPALVSLVEQRRAGVVPAASRGVRGLGVARVVHGVAPDALARVHAVGARRRRQRVGLQSVLRHRRISRPFASPPLVVCLDLVGRPLRPGLLRRLGHLGMRVAEQLEQVDAARELLRGHRASEPERSRRGLEKGTKARLRNENHGNFWKSRHEIVASRRRIDRQTLLSYVLQPIFPLPVRVLHLDHLDVLPPGPTVAHRLLVVIVL